MIGLAPGTRMIIVALQSKKLENETFYRGIKGAE